MVSEMRARELATFDMDPSSQKTHTLGPIKSVNISYVGLFGPPRVLLKCQVIHSLKC